MLNHCAFDLCPDCVMANKTGKYFGNRALVISWSLRILFISIWAFSQVKASDICLWGRSWFSTYLTKKNGSMQEPGQTILPI